jgi:hypothetical protein
MHFHATGSLRQPSEQTKLPRAQHDIESLNASKLQNGMTEPVSQSALLNMKKSHFAHVTKPHHHLAAEGGKILYFC